MGQKWHALTHRGASTLKHGASTLERGASTLERGARATRDGGATPTHSTAHPMTHMGVSDAAFSWPLPPTSRGPFVPPRKCAADGTGGHDEVLDGRVMVCDL